MTDRRMTAVLDAAEAMRSWAPGFAPEALVVLGSGLGGVVEDMRVAAEEPFASLPGFATSAVAGHAGRFLLGEVAGRRVIAMMGRLHLYEGHPVDQVVLPVRAVAALGCRVLLATNAAGGISAGMRVARPMLVTDHLNLLGVNPLTGPNLEDLGTRFPVMAGAYSPRLLAMARGLAAERGIELAEGVYAAVPGPSYETPAEVRALRALGADAVGMSTVPEVIAARHAGMEVAAFSLISNVAADIAHGHEGVLAAAEAGAPVLASLLTGIIERL
ncbi:MAG TPA: purine-nucleoside phosphorylase [Coriobacteriia bacterium]|jgi:purine-nucleoside phosphorylase